MGKPHPDTDTRVQALIHAAVYGDADGVVTEDAPTVPVNPYGETKLAGEWLAADVARAEGHCS